MAKIRIRDRNKDKSKIDALKAEKIAAAKVKAAKKKKKDDLYKRSPNGRFA